MERPFAAGRHADLRDRARTGRSRRRQRDELDRGSDARARPPDDRGAMAGRPGEPAGAALGGAARGRVADDRGRDGWGRAPAERDEPHRPLVWRVEWRNVDACRGCSDAAEGGSQIRQHVLRGMDCRRICLGIAIRERH